MNKVEIIIGVKGSGKTTKARELSEGLKTKWLNGRTFNFKTGRRFEWNVLEEDTELVIIDDIKTVDFNPLRIYEFYSGITVHKQGKEPFEINPKFILVFDDLTRFKIRFWEQSIQRRIGLINLRIKNFLTP